MEFSLKVMGINTFILFWMKKKPNKKWDTQFESKKELYQFPNIYMYNP